MRQERQTNLKKRLNPMEQRRSLGFISDGPMLPLILVCGRSHVRCSTDEFGKLGQVLVSKMSRPTLTQAPLASLYKPWYGHFLRQSESQFALPWPDSYMLCDAERRLISRSVQQFQLGEWARGRGLVRRASSHSLLSIDRWFLSSLELFIAEEQCHSRLLGRFLDRERIPRLNNHWVDRVFRQLRKLAGLEVCVMVLVTAEVLAVPFYQALRDATRSQLLRSICKRILCDEAAHLDYQALTLGLIRRPLSNRARGIRVLCHSILFHCTALLLWQQHHVVFRAAGWDFRRFWAQARRGFARLQLKIWRLSLGGAGRAGSQSSSCHRNDLLRPRRG